MMFQSSQKSLQLSRIPEAYQEAQNFVNGAHRRHCGTLACFAVGSEGAAVFAREFTSPIPTREFQDLPRYELFLRTLRDGTPVGPYRLSTFVPQLPAGECNPAEVVIRSSLARRCQPMLTAYGQLNGDI